MSDRRSSQRIAVALRAQYRTSSGVIDGVVQDLSREGMFLATDSVEAPGSSGQIDVELPGEHAPVQVRGEVVRVGTRSGRKGLGIRLQTDVEARRPLANFIMRWAFWNRR